jgi:hypothetical protein
MDLSEAKRLTALEEENTKLKKLLADAILDNAALKDLLIKKMVTPAVKREAVAHLQGAHGMSERRACKAIGCDRMTVRYQSRPVYAPIETVAPLTAKKSANFNQNRSSAMIFALYFSANTTAWK